MTKHLYWAGGLLAAASITLVFLAPARAQDQPGVLWESTSQIVMPGLPFSPPPMKLKVCAAAQWTQPPVASDPSQNCTSSNMQQTDTGVTWTMTCESPPMTGEGEIQFISPDEYSGEIRMTSDEGSMTMKIAGKKLGGCDNPR
jgi:hypothetical protein